MSRNPQEVPGTVTNPLGETIERDEAGNPVREIIQEQVKDELKEE